jgi:DNA-directed RNA polymerase subunit beta
MPLPDLVAVQRDSFKWFLEEGIAETLTDISPIEDFTRSTPRRSARRRT